MKEKIEKLLFGAIAVGIPILSIAGFVLLIIGGAKLFEIMYPFLEGVSYINWGIVWLLLLLSIIPSLRIFTGSGIVLGTYIGGVVFWLLCFYVTYSLWGALGIIVGVLFVGLGVFATAVLALLFDGQFGTGFYFIFILAQIYIFRLVGFWIISKYRSKEDNSVNYLNEEENIDKSTSIEQKINTIKQEDGLQKRNIIISALIAVIIVLLAIAFS